MSRDQMFKLPLNRKERHRIISLLRRKIDRLHLRYTYYEKFGGRPPTPEEAAAARDAAEDSMLSRHPSRSPAFLRAVSEAAADDGYSRQISRYNWDRQCSSSRREKGDQTSEEEDEEQDEDEEIDFMDVPWSNRNPFTMKEYREFEQKLKNATLGKEAWKKPNDGGPPGGAWTRNSGRRNPVVGIANRFVKDPSDRWDQAVVYGGRKRPGRC